ncbi:MAG: hypothetical protein ABIQ89_00175 [Candidatus Saccharimonadales bacterium]
MKTATSANSGYKYFTKRNLLGALLFLIFVGEPTVGLYNGLFTPPGLIVLGGLYLSLFWLYEALIVRYKLSNAQLVPLTFAIYAVLVTGLLHGELANYAKGEAVITTLIRVQCSLFPIFAYHILNRYMPRPSTVPSIKKASLILVGFFLLLTPSHQFGFANMIETIQKVPALAVIYIIMGIAAFAVALKPTRQTSTFAYKNFTALTWGLFVLACIPNLISFLILLLAMPIVVLVYWRQPAFRHAKA